MRINEINEKLQSARETADLTPDEKEYMTRLGYVTAGLAVVGAFTVLKKVARLIS